MSIADIDATVSSITEALENVAKVKEPEYAVYASEFIQLLNAIRAFKDFFHAHQAEYGFSWSKILELDSYVMQFPSPKFGSTFKAKDQNNMVECLRIIADLIGSMSKFTKATLYWAYEYQSPILMSAFTTYLSGHLTEYQKWYQAHGLSYALGLEYWFLKSFSASKDWMGAYEAWFKLGRQFNTLKVTITRGLMSGSDGILAQRVVALGSGSPLGKDSLHVWDRFDLWKFGKGDYTYTYPAPSKNIFSIPCFGVVEWLVVCLMDDSDTKWLENNFIFKVELENV